MEKRLINKRILLGVTGGIAAYKSADLVRRLRESGADVRVVMTASAKEFITPLTLQALSGYPVHDDLFDLKAEAAMGHIELARWADVVLVAPATADFIARLVGGEANDLLTTLCLATSATIAIAPAMNQGMWKNTSTQHNLQAIKEKKIHIFGPGDGSQACGEVGPGRMLEPMELVECVTDIFNKGILSNKRILITAGPTHEAIDPIRYITNASSGKMGYALATAAQEAGGDVTLISGPVNLEKPQRVKIINVISAQEMFDAVMEQVNSVDIFISVAAVADYRCKTISTQKLKKNNLEFNLVLKPNPDIVATVASLPKKPFVVGFAAETNNVIEYAKRKLEQKKLDMIVANEVSTKKAIGADDNTVTVLWQKNQKEFECMSKTKLARELIELIADVDVVA